MPKKILLSEAAYYDIDSIFSYVSQDNKKAAEMLRTRIYNAIAQLADFPEKGAVLPEEDAPGAERGYRRIVQNSYIIFYRVLDDKIVIARVLHGRQNWLQSLFEISKHE
ncbi:MAG: type II toxin-antitoxin system RelE/ParE family toxin [Bacillota bacterium]|jgi:toxin ParE1/3/4